MYAVVTNAFWNGFWSVLKNTVSLTPIDKSRLNLAVNWANQFLIVFVRSSKTEIDQWKKALCVKEQLFLFLWMNEPERLC